MSHLITLALGASLITLPALAHVTLDQASLPADSYVRVVLRVPHGCEGAATTGIRLQIPGELRDARPMPLAGWTLTVSAGEPTADSHGSASLPHEVAWRGGNLPDNQYGEFVLRVRTPAQPGGTLVFPIVQECEGGRVSRWIERAPPGGPEPRFPAYLVRVVPKG